MECYYYYIEHSSAVVLCSLLNAWFVYCTDLTAGSRRSSNTAANAAGSDVSVTRPNGTTAAGNEFVILLQTVMCLI